MIFMIWCISIIVSLAPLFGWKDPQFEDRVNIDKVCLVSQDIGYQIFATMMTFYVPLVIILLLYWRIFMTARTRLRKRLAAKANVNLTTNGNANKKAATSSAALKVAKDLKQAPKSNNSAGLPPATSLTTVGTKKHSVVVEQNASGGQPITRIEVIENEAAGIDEAVAEVKTRFVSQGCQTDRSMASNHHHFNNHVNESAETQPLTADTQAQQLTQSAVASANAAGRPVTVTTPNGNKKHVSLEVKRERKAAKTLAIVTGAFIACWLPFFIMALFMAIFKNWHFNQHLVSFFLWLGYFNSTLNPLIYTIFSPEFRTAFKRILCGKSHVLNHRPRHLQ